jgi:hypothetical protein
LHLVIALVFAGYWRDSVRLASPVLLGSGTLHLGFCMFAFSYILVFYLLTCYFAGVFWWALVAAVTENGFIGELFFLDVLVVLQ